MNTRSKSILALRCAKFCAAVVICATAAVTRAVPPTQPGEVTITVDPTVVVKAHLPERPIGVSENIFLSSDKHYPNRRFTQAQSLKMIGGKTIRGMEGNIGDFLIWSPPPFNGPDPRLTCYAPKRIYFSQFDNPDGTLQKAMDFGEFVSTGREAGVSEFFYIVGIDAIVALPDQWQWVIPKPLETITAGAAAQARWCKQRGVDIWFEIGNENDLNDAEQMKLRKWEPDEYADVTVRISRAIKAEYPAAKVGINGGFVKDWFDRVIPKVYKDVDFIVVHAYSPTGTYAIQRANASIDKANIPAELKRAWPLCVTETSSYRPGNPVANDLEEATRNFVRMGVNLYEPRVRCMHFWTDRAAQRNPPDGKSALGNDGEPLPMGQALAIWNDHLKSELLKVVATDKDVHVFAMRAPGSAAMTLFLANQGTDAKRLTVQLAKTERSCTADRWAFTGADLHDTHPRWEKSGSVDVRAGSFTLDLSPIGFTMVDFPGR